MRRPNDPRKLVVSAETEVKRREIGNAPGAKRRLTSLGREAMAMMYEVTYQVGGDERTDSVDAPDAASAAASVRESHGQSPDLFELLLVHLVDDDVAERSSAQPHDDEVAVGH